MADYLIIDAAGCFVDAAGDPLPRGVLTVRAVDGAGQDLVFELADKQGLKGYVTREIGNGSLTKALKLANPAATNPVGFGYTFVVTNTDTRARTIYPNVLIADDGSGHFNFGAIVGGSDYPTGLPIVYVDGKSAYDVAVENGFEGTESDWLLSLVGPAGDGSGGGGGGPVSGITFIDSATGAHYSLSVRDGSPTFSEGGSDFGTAVAAIQFIDGVTGTIVTLSFSNGTPIYV